MRRVVITGIGIASPIGVGSQVFWDNLVAGKTGIARISHFDPAGFKCQIAGQVPAYKITDYVPKHYRKATKVMARDIELAVVAADDAMKDAGLKTRAYTETPEIDGRWFGCNIARDSSASILMNSPAPWPPRVMAINSIFTNGAKTAWASSPRFGC